MPDMSQRCEICRGAQTVRLPRYRPVSSASIGAEAPEAISVDKISKTYPCPECAPGAPTDRVAVVEHHQLFLSSIRDPEFARSVKRACAQALGTHLLQNGFIRFRKAPPHMVAHQHLPPDQEYLQATVGVVSTATVATMEQRIEQHQETLARQVIDLAISHIDNWGSAYGYRDIGKSYAIRNIREALTTVLRDRAREKQEV